MEKLSVVMITLNAADTLQATLDSVKFADEIVVVDSGSTDGTLELLKQNNCHVYNRTFDGFGRQKHYAVGLAKNNWVLVLDADEVLNPSLELEILKAIQQTKIRGYSIPRSLVFMGRKLRFGGEYRKNQLRLFNKNYGQFNFDEVHEKIEVNGPLANLKGEMLHYSYRNLKQFIEKLNHYTSLASDKLERNKIKISTWIIMLRLPIDFIRWYFLKGLIFDGYPGFCWAMLSTFYSQVKYAKYWELKHIEI